MHIQNLFTLLYLLLVRHYNIMRAAQQHIIHVDELIAASVSVYMVRDAFEFRRGLLSGMSPFVDLYLYHPY